VRSGGDDAEHGEPDRGEEAPELERLARAVVQRLEVTGLFGWEVPLRASACRPVPAAPTLAPPPRASGGEGQVGGRPAEPADEAAREAREAQLSEVRQEVAACERCGLCQGRTQTVFGVGCVTPRLMFVGEGPGFEEDRQGEPFVGPAGQLLDRIIGAMGLQRSDVYIANIVKCRPPNNRNPEPAESAACIGYLERQLKILGPKIVVTLGAVATRTLLGQDGALGRFRGRFHDRDGLAILPTYHPAYLLRNPADKRKVWDDMKKVLGRLGLELPTKSSS